MFPFSEMILGLETAQRSLCEIIHNAKNSPTRNSSFGEVKIERIKSTSKHNNASGTCTSNGEKGFHELSITEYDDVFEPLSKKPKSPRLARKRANSLPKVKTAKTTPRRLNKSFQSNTINSAERENNSPTVLNNSNYMNISFKETAPTSTQSQKQSIGFESDDPFELTTCRAADTMVHKENKQSMSLDKIGYAQYQSNKTKHV